ncbi:MAG: hypothetical protein ABRQ37_14530, partial [Candidatus Eremiobacterota bacterium]
CPECEFINEGEDFCINCGTDLKGQILPGSADFKISVPERICSCCSYQLEDYKETCSFCGFEQRGLIKDCSEKACPICNSKIWNDKEICYECESKQITQIDIVEDNKNTVIAEGDRSRVIAAKEFYNKYEKISPLTLSDLKEEKISVDVKKHICNRDEKSESFTDLKLKKEEKNVREEDTFILTVSVKFLYLFLAFFIFLMVIFFIFFLVNRKQNTLYIPLPSPSISVPVISENIKNMEDPDVKPSPLKSVIYSTPTMTPEPVPAITSIATVIILVATPVPTVKPYPVVTRKPVIIYQYPSPTAALQIIDDKQTKRIYCNSVLSGKVMTLYNERRYTEAINECNRLINYEPTYYSNYIWMASCYLAANDPEDAKYYIDKALEYEWQEKRLPREQLESEKLYQLYLKYGGKN